MPEFKLEWTAQKTYKHEPNLYYSKKEYSPNVKITNWNQHAESLPIDNDPYCPGSLNYMLSHYKKFSIEPDEPYTTTYRIMSEQVTCKKDKEAVERLYQIPNSYMTNYFSYKDTKSCDTLVKDPMCPPVCAESYVTTMQRSYPPPYPYAMQRFSFPKIPWMHNRRYKFIIQHPEMSEDMFYDECYVPQIHEAQKIKKRLWKSYNPCTFTNTDGTLPPVRKLKIFEQPYKQQE